MQSRKVREEPTFLDRSFGCSHVVIAHRIYTTYELALLMLFTMFAPHVCVCVSHSLYVYFKDIIMARSLEHFQSFRLNAQLIGIF